MFCHRHFAHRPLASSEMDTSYIIFSPPLGSTLLASPSTEPDQFPCDSGRTVSRILLNSFIHCLKVAYNWLLRRV